MSDDRSQVDLAGFIKSNSELFVVMGVFSALAIYISQISETPLPESAMEIRVGFTGALMLSLLILVLVYRQLIREFGTFSELLDAHANPSNWDLILFTVGTALLAPSLILPILDRLSAIYYLISLSVLAIGIPTCARSIRKIRSSLPKSQPERAISSLVLSLLAYFTGEKIVRYIRQRPDLTGLDAFTLTSPFPPIIDAIGVIALLVQGGAYVAALIALMSYSDQEEGQSELSEN